MRPSPTRPPRAHGPLARARGPPLSAAHPTVSRDWRVFGVGPRGEIGPQVH